MIPVLEMPLWPPCKGCGKPLDVRAVNGAYHKACWADRWNTPCRGCGHDKVGHDRGGKGSCLRVTCDCLSYKPPAPHTQPPQPVICVCGHLAQKHFHGAPGSNASGCTMSGCTCDGYQRCLAYQPDPPPEEVTTCGACGHPKDVELRLGGCNVYVVGPCKRCGVDL